MTDPMAAREKKREQARPSPLTLLAFGLLGVALLSFCLTGVVLESVVNRLPTSGQRIILAVTVVLPATLGTLSAFLAVVQREHRSFGAFVAFGLNVVVALFFTFLLLVAG